MLPVPNKPCFMVSVDVKHHERRKRLIAQRATLNWQKAQTEKRYFFCQNNQMRPDNVNISSCIFYVCMSAITETPQPKANHFPTSHVSPLNCCLSVVL